MKKQLQEINEIVIMDISMNLHMSNELHAKNVCTKGT